MSRVQHSSVTAEACSGTESSGRMMRARHRFRAVRKRVQTYKDDVSEILAVTETPCTQDEK